MKIFSDYHHSGLFYSLHLLFEKRLGFELYRPIGMEWFPEWWDIAKPYNQNEDTARQYLDMRDSEPFYSPKDGSPVLNSIVDQNPNYYVVEELVHGYRQKAITFQQFLDMDIDIFIASIPDHWVTYTKLRDTYKPKAKVICQMGNIFWENEEVIRGGIVKNLLASTKEFSTPGVHSVFYHQEQPVIPYKDPEKTGKITSFVHLLPKKEQFFSYEAHAPQFDWKAYGAGSVHGWITKLEDVYRHMQNSEYIYHVKPHGDGYGWVWHSAFMVGRPVLTNFSDYKDKLGGLLFEDGVTGVDLERRTVQENCAMILKFHNEDYVIQMSRNARKRWEEVVNYDKEEENIRKFLDHLI